MAACSPRLLAATPAARLDRKTGGDGSGLHREKLDEDTSVEDLLPGIGDRTAHLPRAA